MQTQATLESHLQAREIRFSTRENRVTFTFDMQSTLARCAMDCYDEGLKLTIDNSFKCPPNRSIDAGRFILAANFGAWGGRLDYNERTGLILYTSTISYGEGDLTDDMIAALIGRSIFNFERYLQGLLRVIYGHEDPLDVADECDARDLDSDDDAEDSELKDEMWSEFMDRLTSVPEEPASRPQGEFDMDGEFPSG